VARVTGGSFPPHEDADLKAMDWYWGDGYSEETHPGLFVFFMHSDCDGEIAPEKCVQVADELEALLPAVEAEGQGAGHIESAGGYGAVLERFIKGCRMAAAANVPLEFA
jgi:hypothetical protein